MVFLKGILLLIAVFLMFTLFSLKMPKGTKAMNGLANAAIASFLVEAIHKYVGGDIFSLGLLGSTGATSGSLGGVASVILVSAAMGANPVFAVSAGIAVMEFGILPGFIAGYVIGLISPWLEKKIPDGINIIAGALIVAPLARVISIVSAPAVETVLMYIGDAIVVATHQSPLLMGFVLGGIIKMICTSPLSSMALTAMLSLTGPAMGIASIACFGGSFTNGTVFSRLKLGDRSKVIAVMLEPLTQADIITRNPVPIYMSNFLGGGLSGMIAASLGIVNNAPGTASPIPGMIAPFAFNDPGNVVLALVFSAIAGLAAGWIGTGVYRFMTTKSLKIKKRLGQAV